MQAAESFFFYLFATLMIIVLIGLYKPWITLWWVDKQSRKRVLHYYGIPGLVCLLVYMALKIF